MTCPLAAHWVHGWYQKTHFIGPITVGSCFNCWSGACSGPCSILWNSWSSYMNESLIWESTMCWAPDGVCKVRGRRWWCTRWIADMHVWKLEQCSWLSSPTGWLSLSCRIQKPTLGMVTSMQCCYLWLHLYSPSVCSSISSSVSSWAWVCGPLLWLPFTRRLAACSPLPATGQSIDSFPLDIFEVDGWVSLWLAGFSLFKGENQRAWMGLLLSEWPPITLEENTISFKPVKVVLGILDPDRNLTFLSSWPLYLLPGPYSFQCHTEGIHSRWNGESDVSGCPTFHGLCQLYAPAVVGTSADCAVHPVSVARTGPLCACWGWGYGAAYSHQCCAGCQG